MAKLVFALKYVPEEEANDIRALLTENEIEFYETTAGRWQISLAAIWVRHNEDFQRARALIEEDQQQRAKPKASGNSFLLTLAHAKQNPLEFFLTLVAICFVGGLSILPFML